jgi:N4-gp56 family major capsid protein
MALGSDHVTTTIAGNFIPELWSDEVIGAYKSNLVIANLVTKLSHKGKKGDTIHIPVPNRGDASAKAANTQVTLIASTNSVINVSIDQHYEYSKLIEDIAEVQSLASMRKFYTDDAGYALAKQVDTKLGTLWEGLQSGTVGGSDASSWETAYTINSGDTALELYTGNASNARDITDVAIRALNLKLDDADVPMDNRSLIIPPIAANDLLGINRFTEQQYIGSGDAIATGKIGMIYGANVYISSNCPTASDSTAPYNTDRVGVLLHKDALVLAEQLGVRSQTQYKQEYLGDLFTSDTLYGVAELRNDAGVAFVVPAS